jgi:hypothetical protein
VLCGLTRTGFRWSPARRRLSPQGPLVPSLLGHLEPSIIVDACPL